MITGRKKHFVMITGLVKSMDVADGVVLLEEIVRFRIMTLENEIDVMKRQAAVMCKAPGLEANLNVTWMHMVNVKVALHEVLMAYYDGIHKSLVEKSLFDVHMRVLGSRECNVAIGALLGQQSALNGIVGEDYLKYSNDENVPYDMQLRILQNVFPYNLELELLRNREFFQLLLTEVTNYSANGHQECIRRLFGFISTVDISIQDLFYTPGPALYFMICEHILSCCVYTKMIESDLQPLENFAVSQRCQLIISQDIITFGVKEKLWDLVRTEYSKLATEKGDEVESVTGLASVKEELVPDKETIPMSQEMMPLEHIVLELKRMTFQVSPSAMLCVLANANRWLTGALTTDGEVVGTDDLLPFLVYAISMADIRYLPAVISFIERFYDEGLSYTKFSFLINQLDVILDFVKQKMLPVKQYLLFPFHEVPKVFKDSFTCYDEIELRGFRTYAFPTFTHDFDKIFPCFLMYTGNRSDVAVAYQFSVSSTIVSAVNRFDDMELIPALHGSFFQLPEAMLSKYHMIEIDSGTYDQAIPKVIALSAMMKMLPNVVNPKISEVDSIYERLCKRYRMRGVNYVESVMGTIAELQKQMVLAHDRDVVAVTGILDETTVNALARLARVPASSSFRPEDFDTVLEKTNHDIQKILDA